MIDPSTESNLRRFHAIVEQALANLGVNPSDCQSEQSGTWIVRKGSARLTVEIYQHEQTQIVYCRVYCPIMQVPADRAPELYAELLDLNMDYVGVTFGTSSGWVYLKSDREAEGMDVSELYYMITRVGNLSDHYDDILLEKYMGQKASDVAPPPRPIS
jgi:hypothetical protein